MAGAVSEAAIEDDVEAWHVSDDLEVRSLGAFLGMTEQEYVVWVMDGRTLPLLRAARRAGQTLSDAVAGYVDDLQAAGDPGNWAAVLSLSHWLERQAGV